LGWRYSGNNDANYSSKVDDNRIKAVALEGVDEKQPELENLQQIFLS